MQHKPVIIETKELNDEQVSYLVRCCDDEQTDSWHTTHVTAPDHDDKLNEHIQAVADRHEAKIQWREKINTKK